ncbi:MAG TPA: hypothetical protein VK137_08205, partial [Planctomycetaceae bacterium]|nr:hypothetical protein [Planctomycetaceae bacterium]
RPAKFLFVEDLKPDSFKDVQAALIVGQTVELDPPLKLALAEARKAGVRVFFDGTCREELVQAALPDATALGVSFNKISTYAGELAQDDSLYVRVPRWFFEHALDLKKILADVPPVAECNQPEVLLFERFSGDARFVWAVNNTMMLEQNPGQAWRTSLIMSQRAPVVAMIDFKSGGDFVYDVFGHNRRRSPKGPMNVPAEQPAQPASHFAEPLDTSKPILADLRSSPVRLYAILPVKPNRMTVTVPNANLRVGQELEWKVQAFDVDGKEINANLPIRITALGQKKNVLKDLFTTTLGRAGASGALTTPAPPFGSQVSVNLNQLLTPAEKADLGRVETTLPRVGATAPEHRFGPHFKELAIS